MLNILGQQATDMILDLLSQGHRSRKSQHKLAALLFVSSQPIQKVVIDERHLAIKWVCCLPSLGLLIDIPCGVVT